jgi:hypothetical protein
MGIESVKMEGDRTGRRRAERMDREKESLGRRRRRGWSGGGNLNLGPNFSL